VIFLKKWIQDDVTIVVNSYRLILTTATSWPWDVHLQFSNFFFGTPVK